jgi:hypothetical protein
MRTFIFLAVTIGGLVVGYYWCFGKPSFPSVAGAKSAPSSSMSVYEKERLLKQYLKRAAPHEMSGKTEKKGT